MAAMTKIKQECFHPFPSSVGVETFYFSDLRASAGPSTGQPVLFIITFSSIPIQEGF